MERSLNRIIGSVDPERILSLLQDSIRIPSPTTEEGVFADYLAARLRELELDVTMHTLEDTASGHKTRQPVALWRGTGGGRSLVFNGHMDHNPVVGQWDFDPFCGDYRDGWVLGRGAQDEKAGLVAAIHAIEVLKHVGVRPRGDVWVTPVALHKHGGQGTEYLIMRGVKPDYCINTENSGLGVATVGVGVIRWRASAYARPIHFHGPAKGSSYMQPAEQLMSLLRALGRAYARIDSGGWCTFTPHPELTEYPQFAVESIKSAHLDGVCTMEVDTRVVPGQTVGTLRTDLEHLVSRLSETNPGIHIQLEIPARGLHNVSPFETPADSPLVQAIVHSHRVVTGQQPVVGALPRIGGVGDGNLLSAAGVETVVYGPGSLEEYNQWPASNERVRLADVVTAAKAYLLTAISMCSISRS